MTNGALTFDDLGFPLSHATFVVIDLETTGTNSADSGITEIGAVKVQGGQIIGEFQTFVNPGAPIPAFISVLTGITDAHVATAPRIDAALPMLLEFCGFAGPATDMPIMVAHNAGFDSGFLKAACHKTGTAWPSPIVLDTVTLARRILRGGEVHNHKLGTLAAYFGAETTPTHRALDDARATVDVLHGLIGRVGNLGVTDVESLLAFDGKATESRRRKRHLADGIPAVPGVYIFRDGTGRPLYIGVSRNMRNRVRSYFTAAETRRRMTSMVELAQEVTAIACATSLEARVRELRLIEEHRPRFNVRSRNPERTAWVTLTAERYPRLSIVRDGGLFDDSRTSIGPFAGTGRAQLAIEALHESTSLRQCTTRLTSAHNGTPCVLRDMNRCAAPCIDPNAAPAYADQVERAATAMTSDPSSVMNTLRNRMSLLASQERYEQAALVRDRIEALTAGTERAAVLRALCRIPEFVAAAPAAQGGWDIHVIRHGWLAAAAYARTAADVTHIAQAAAHTAAEHPGKSALVAESSLLAHWLETAGLRFLEMTDGYGWHMPAGMGRYEDSSASADVTATNESSERCAAPESMDCAAATIARDTR